MKLSLGIKHLAGLILGTMNGGFFTNKAHEEELPLPLAILTVAIGAAIVGLFIVIAIAYITR